MSIVDPDFDMAALDRPPQAFRDIATQQGQIWWLAKFIVAINNVFDDVNATITTLPAGSSPTVDVTFENDTASFDFKIPVMQGEPGTPGAAGVGISNITFNSNYTMTITTTDGQTYTSESLRGATGATGATGPAGATGATGATGNGISNIVFNNDYTMTITTTDGNTWTSGSLRGPQGPQGPAGSGGGGGVHFATDTNTSSVASRTLTFAESEYSPADGDILAISVTRGISSTTEYPGYMINNLRYSIRKQNEAFRHFTVAPASYLFVTVDAANKRLYPIGILGNEINFDYSDTYFATCSSAANAQNKYVNASGYALPYTPYFCLYAIRFVNGNTSPTMKFSHGPSDYYDVYYRGIAVSATNPLPLDPNDVLILTYTIQSRWEVVGILSNNYPTQNASATAWNTGDVNEFDEGAYDFDVNKTNGVYHGSISSDYIGDGLTTPGSWSLFATLDPSAYKTILFSAGKCDVLTAESNGVIEIKIAPKANMNLVSGETVTVDFMAV